MSGLFPELGGLGSLLDTITGGRMSAIDSQFKQLNDAIRGASRSQNGGTPDQAISATWRDPVSYSGGATTAPNPDTRNRKRGGISTF